MMGTTTPTPAAGSELEPTIDEILVDMTNVCNDCEHQVCLEQLKAGRKRILNLITAQNNATYEAVMEAFDKYREYLPVKPLGAETHNEKMAYKELRESIAKIYGRGE